MTILKTRDNITRIIRDYIYDTTSPNGPSGTTVFEVGEALTAIRSGQSTSAGVIRRTLNDLRSQGLLLLNEKTRPPTYRWNPAAGKPGDYQHRAVPVRATAAIPATTTTTGGCDDHDRRRQKAGSPRQDRKPDG